MEIWKIPYFYILAAQHVGAGYKCLLRTTKTFLFGHIPIHPNWPHSIRYISYEGSLIARFTGPTWGAPGADRTQVGPMLPS